MVNGENPRGLALNQQRKSIMSQKLVWLLVAALLLSACGPAAPAATPTPTKTTTPIAQAPEPVIETPAPPTDTPVVQDTPTDAALIPTLLSLIHI